MFGGEASGHRRPRTANPPIGVSPSWHVSRLGTKQEGASLLGYVRVSTDRQAAEDRTSLADQEAAITKRAAGLGGVVSQWFRDEGASGASVEKRPAFRALLDHCERNRRPADKPGTILVLNESRFGRFPDPEEAAHWRWHLRRLGWHVRYAEGDVQDMPFAATVRMMGSDQSSEYRRNLIANVRRGMKGTGEQGYWGREAPLGYRRREVGSGRVLDIRQPKAPDERVKLVPHEEEAKVVRWMFETYARGTSAAALARQLEDKIPYRRWGSHTALQVLRNPAYVGDVVAGRNRRHKLNTPYECRDAHPAIVSRDLFARVQERIEQSGAQTRTGKENTATYLLSGILTCAQCGHPYAGGGGGRKHLAHDVNERRRLYRCSGGVLGKCPGKPKIPTIMRHIIEPVVIDAVCSILERPETQYMFRAVYEDFHQRMASEDPSKALRAERSRLEARRERLVALMADGVLTGDEARRQMESARAGLDRVDAELAATRSDRERIEMLMQERDAIMSVTQNIREFLNNTEGPARRAHLVPWIEAAIFDKHIRQLWLAVRPLPGPLPAETLAALGGFGMWSIPLREGALAFRMAKVLDSPLLAEPRQVPSVAEQGNGSGFTRTISLGRGGHRCRRKTSRNTRA